MISGIAPPVGSSCLPFNSPARFHPFYAIMVAPRCFVSDGNGGKFEVAFRHYLLNS